MSTLAEIKAAQPLEAEPTETDLVYVGQGENPRVFSIGQLLSLVPEAEVPSTAQIIQMDDDFEVTEAHKGAIINTATANTLTINADTTVGWYVWVVNGMPTDTVPTFTPNTVTLSAPAGATAPASISMGIYVLRRSADDVSVPETPVPVYTLIDIINPAGFAELDDVLYYNDFASLPDTGNTGVLYITLDTRREYRWSGTSYERINALVKSYANYAALPAAGPYTVGALSDMDAIYITEDNNKMYRYNGSAYVELGKKAAHVGDADDASLGAVAASVDAIRDALVAAGLMAAE